MVQWSGGPVVWWFSVQVVWWSGGPVVLWFGNPVVRWYGGLVVRWFGGMVVQLYGGTVLLQYSSKRKSYLPRNPRLLGKSKILKINITQFHNFPSSLPLSMSATKWWKEQGVDVLRSLVMHSWKINAGRYV